MIKSNLRTAIILSIAVVLAACSSAAPNRLPATPTTVPVVTLPQEPTITLQPCTLGTTPAQCGTLRVYENRAARTGRMIDLRVAVIKARSDQPVSDPIFYLAGGPGDAATEDAARGQQFPSSLSENHDLVFVDQRGTGGSNRVLIPGDQPDLTGLTPEEIDTRLKDWVAKFLLTIDMDPRYYTTSIAMDDLDEVRQALGYDKINLFGYSYGATAAQYYLRQYEDHVRTVTLGGGSLLDIPVFERWAYNGQRALADVFDRCLADPACHAAFPDLQAEFKGLIDRLATQPVTQTYTSATNPQGGEINYTAESFGPVVRHMTKDARTARSLPLLIHRAYQENNWQGFNDFVIAEGGYEWWGNQLMEHVIRCSEKWAAFDPEAVSRLSGNSYLKDWDMSLARSQAFSCKYTPAGETPEGVSLQPGSRVPVLIVNGAVDPIDPPDNMTGASALWPNSRVVVLPFQGHAISDRTAVVCLWSIMDEFIQSGSVNGLHTDCLQNITAPPFEIN